jgi:hypothetical protein
LPNGKKAINDMAMISVDKYLYSVEFVTPKGKPQEKLMKIFFDSVKLSETLVQKYNELNGGLAPAALAKKTPGNQTPQITIPDTPKVEINVPPMNTPLVKSAQPNTVTTTPINSVNATPKKIGWSVEPDPLPRQPEWEMAKKIEINLPDLADAVYLPDPFGAIIISKSRFSSFKEVSLFSLTTGEREHHFRGGPPNTFKHCFSPDAKRLATYQIKTGLVEIWDLYAGKLTHKLPFDEEKDTIKRMVFTDPNHVLIMQWQKPDIKKSIYSIYDLTEKSDSMKPFKVFVDKSM